MEKIWFILIEGNREGPYSLIDLTEDNRITPDTLVWKEGFKDWIPMRDVPELNAVFEDATKNDEDEDYEAKKLSKKIPLGDEVLALQSDPPFIYLWLFIVLILLYVLYQFYR